MRFWQTLAIRNLTGSGAGRILKDLRSEADIVSDAAPQPKADLSRRLGLSGKLLLLTIPLVMIAEVLIYVPSIANFRVNPLNDRLAAANTSAPPLDPAPPRRFPDSL